MSQKAYLAILKGGIFLAFLSVFFVFRNLLFPYISSKQLYFNILIEAMSVVWLAFIVKYPSFRPKLSLISYGLIAFFSAILLSSIFGVNFNLSFWGNIERMLGFFQLAHFLVFYFILITVLRTWDDWKYVMLGSVIAALFVSLYGIAQNLKWIESPWNADRIISTIGNSAYVGAYTIFNLFFAAILLWKEKNIWARYFYGGSMIFIFWAMIISGTRGAYMGLAASILIMLFLFSLFNQNKKIKLWSLISFAVAALALAGLFLNADKPFITNNLYLNRLAHISFTDATMQTRLISWKAALKDFHNHPILGTGHGNYAITFDKYFDPIFLSYTASETYFDRAHNNIVDITSTTGLLGILSYLSIFAAAIYYLIRGYRQGRIELAMLVFIIGLIIAYFIQNLVVFDALVTYIALMIMLGLINWLAQKDGNAPGKISDRGEIKNGEFYAWLFGGLFMLVIIYQYNIKPINMLDATIMGQQYSSQGSFVQMVDAYKKAMSYGSIMSEDPKSTYIRLISASLSTLQSLDPKVAADALDFAVKLAQENIKNNPKDSLNLLQTAQLLDTASKFYSNDKEKFSYYSDWALETVNKSIESSPGRIPVYFYKSQILLTRGEKEKALEALKHAAELNPKFGQSYCHLARIELYYKNEKDGFMYMDKCIDSGPEGINDPSFVKYVLDHYIKENKAKRLIVLFQKLTYFQPKDAQAWVELAKLYAKDGQKAAAMNAADQAVKADPGLAGSADKFKENLK